MNYALTSIDSRMWTDRSDYVHLSILSARLCSRITGDRVDYMAEKPFHIFDVVTWGCGWICPWWPFPPLQTQPN